MSALEPHVVDRDRTTGRIEVIGGPTFNGKTEEAPPLDGKQA
jgi:thymidine kinase